MTEVQRHFRFGNAGVPTTDATTLSRDNLTLLTVDGRNGSSDPTLMSAWLGGQLRIPLYSVIFVLAVVGNSLVIVTLAQNRRMRTVTNVFLLNLSVSDLLLAVFCMPFTLIPTLLKDFIFGKVICVLIRYMQGVSVGVSVLTLVAISLERYYAICHPLTSRRWQTRSHAYRIIAAVWVVALSAMVPIAVYQKLPRLRNGAHKCTEIWDDSTLEQAYTIFLDLVLLVVPLSLMLIAYGWITYTLWRGIQLEIRNAQEMTSLKKLSEQEYDTKPGPHNGSCSAARKDILAANCRTRCSLDKRYYMRHSNAEKNLVAKKRVIKMLFVVVLEFFICWTPLYALQTWIVYDYAGAVSRVSPTTMSFIHLLSYVSSCCNPITYCFMNRTFRQGFLAAFGCCCRRRRVARYSSRRTDVSYMTSQRTDVTSAHAYPSVDYN